MPYRHEAGKRVRIESWEGHIDQTIREAQQRGEFDNLPGTGKPLDLDENPHAGEWQSAFRMARNAGAAPLWVSLDREITADLQALQEMARRTARYIRLEQARLEQARLEQARLGRAGGDPEGAGAPGASGAPRARPWWHRFLFGAPPAGEGVVGAPRTLDDLEGQRQRARRLYLRQAANVDEKIRDFNSHRPRNLTWLEKLRLLPEAAARDFDALCPPVVEIRVETSGEAGGEAGGGAGTTTEPGAPDPGGGGGTAGRRA